MHCPKDDTVCKTETIDNFVLDICPKCNGVWLEKDEVKKLVRGLSTPDFSDADELIDKWNVAESSGTEPKEFWSEDKIGCPIGHGFMKKHYFAGTNIGVDQCQVCLGFWLDGGEIQAVARHVEPNPAEDALWQAVIQADNALRKSGEEFEQGIRQLPANIHQMIVNPAYAAIVIGSFLVKWIVDYVTYGQNSENVIDV